MTRLAVWKNFFDDIKANAAAKRAATDGGNVSSSTTNQNPASQAPAQETKVQQHQLLSRAAVSEQSS